MNLLEIVNRFQNQKILVIGDLVADETVLGSPQRISREAPVLILQHQQTEISPGCAANTINNIREFGATVYAAGVIGDDHPGHTLTKLLTAKDINTDGLIIEAGRSTPTKTRIWAGDKGLVKQQLVRIDSGSREEITPETGAKLIAYLRSIIADVDAIIFSDYGYGSLPAWLVSELIQLASEYQIKTTADSRYKLDKFVGVTVATPNKQESEELLGKKLQTDKDAEIMGREICDRINAQAVVITRGGDGMSVVEADGTVNHIRAFNKSQVYDVTGAGDTVIATLTLGLASGATFVEAALCANIAASIVIRKIGAATVHPTELATAIRSLEEHLVIPGDNMLRTES